MNTLWKILEEIDEKIKFAGKLMVEKPQDKLDKIANDTAETYILAYSECEEIIKKYMSNSDNNGWIPCSERLPTKEECEKDGNEFIVQTLDGYRFSCEYDPLANGYDNPFWCCNVSVIAWCPLPEPYKPLTETPDAKRQREREEFFEGSDFFRKRFMEVQ